MIVCRTLDYIVNPDLHKFLLSKFDKAKDMGIEIEIELTEHIDDLMIDLNGFFRIIDTILGEAFKSIIESDIKKLVFCMFYKGDCIHFIINYHISTKSDEHTHIVNLCKRISKVSKKYDAFQSISIDDFEVTHEICVSK